MMPQVSSNVTTNYNRVTTPFSRMGTRRLQAYDITVSGISDADALWTEARDTAGSYEEWVAASAEVGITIETTDRNYQMRWPSNSIHTAILKGAGDVAELYCNGFYDEHNYDPDDNRIRIVVFVAEDTFIDGANPDFELGNNNSRAMIDAIFNQIQNFDWGSISVHRVELVGAGFYDTYDPVAGGGTAGPNAFMKSEPGTRSPNQQTKSEIAARLRRK